ncbi:U6 snRNA phosphodiesterase 1-like isoform X1 [Glandiceps talaboti]
MNNALSIVQCAYGSSSDSSSSDSENDEIKEMKHGRKRKVSCSKDDNNACKSQKVKVSNRCESLPLPSGILDMFSDTGTDRKSSNDDDNEHKGRIRSFAHEAGNWATYVYIPYNPDEKFHQLISSLLQVVPSNLDMQTVEDFHISLSRTVILRHHWIDSFIDSVRQRLSNWPSFTLTFETPEFYTNEEKTRSFLGLKISAGHDNLLSLTTEIDQSLGEFRLPKFYEDPSFHISILWCVGDIRSKVKSNLMISLQKTFDDFMCRCPAYRKLNAKELRCKTGNKHFSFWLR